MLILTGVSFTNDKVRVFDTDDGAHEEVSFSALVRRMDNVGEHIYGLRPFNAKEMYPPDAKPIPQLGVVVVPSEAQKAMHKYKGK